MADILVALFKRPIPDLPEEFLDPAGLSMVYHYLSNPEQVPDGVTVDERYIWDSLAPSIRYIEKRYDCADFRLQLLFRLYKDCKEKLPQSVQDLIKKTCLEFKYWMDEPGEDSMCYWSENHQLLFAVSEYLHGQEWPEEIFTNSKMTGKEHQEKALKRINIWLEQRFLYGFSEWLSNNYYAEDIAPMSNYIEYSKDIASVERMKIVFDLLWLDVATHSVNNTFVAASSRMYSDNKSSDLFGNRIKAAMQTVWGEEDISRLVQARFAIEQSVIDDTLKLETIVKLIGVDSQLLQNFIAMYKKGVYRVPEVIFDIACDQSEQVIKSAEGLSVVDMEAEGLIGQNDAQIMAQFGAETFTNPEVIANTLHYLSRVKMFRNKFLSPFRFIDIKLLRFFKVPQYFSKKYELMTHGIALGKGNIYCYRTAYYALTTAVAQNVDACGAQGHSWTANIASDLTLYTTQPARDDESHDKYGASPGYWVGNGRQPMSVQDKNINITIYRIPKKKRLLEFYLSDITHAYLPREKYDELEFRENYVFGRRGKVLVALIASGKPAYRPYDAYAASLMIQHSPIVDKIAEINLTKEFDFVMQGGEYHSYITELSDSDKESFYDFKQRILSNKRVQDGNSVVYASQGREIKVDYDGVFEINGTAQPTKYRRYDCVYAQIENKPQEILIAYNKKSLRLNYNKNLRVQE
ncbi:MAG: hypothetical protein PHI19_00735 [Clostridia bacterium]|nr:hypothetical protein [Clostridia bacterium]